MTPHKCPECGHDMAYVIQTDSLKCPSCLHEMPSPYFDGQSMPDPPAEPAPAE